MSVRLIFVRHGEPDYEHDCLTPNGKVQAEKTAERLKDEGITAIYASPMGRARETASYTAKQYGLDITPLDFMHEINWGDKTDTAEENEGSDNSGFKISDKLPYKGHPWSLAFRLLSENPEYITGDAWKEHHYFKDNICMDYYNMISKEFDAFLEKYGMVRKNGLYEQTEARDEIIALFAHGGSGAVMFSHLLNLPFPPVLTILPYGVCSVSIIDFEPQLENVVVPRLSLFNDMNHLGNVKLEPLHFDK